MSNKSYLIIYNPISGLKKQHKTLLPNIVEYLKNNRCLLKIKKTKYAGHAKNICLKYNLSKYNAVIAVGGDGTFNEVINGVMMREDSYIPKLGFVPGGTGNAVMHDLYTLNSINALKNILNNNTIKFDVIKLEFKDKIEYSINIVGWGMVSDINILAEKIRLFGSVRYTIASIYNIFAKKIRNAKIIIDDKEFKESKYLFIMISNTIHTGKGMKVAPNAKVNDGLLDIIILDSNISKINLLKLFPKIFSGQHIKSNFIKYINGRKIEIIPEINSMLNIDGENKCITPVKISIINNKLPVFCK